MGKSIVVFSDGFQQHLPSMIYTADYVKEFFKNLFIEHKFILPQFDLSIGLGNNIAGTLNFYGFGDILLVFSALVPVKYMEVFYTFCAFFRLYIMGITFYFFAKSHKQSNSAILVGSLIYVFSFYTIMIVAEHPLFFNPAMYFPLILLGIDNILQKQKPLLFTITCILACYSSVYFFYMITILCFVYAVVHYYFCFGKNFCFKHFAKKFAICAVCYVIAIIASLPVFLSFVQSVLGVNRVGINDFSFVYPVMYYAKLPLAFINACAGNYANFGYTVIGALAVVLLFFASKKKNTELKVFFIIGTVLLLSALAGSVLNGFGYSSNRWCWAYCLVVSMIIVKFVPVFTKLLTNKYQWLLLLSIFVTSLPTYCWWLKDKSNIVAIAKVFAIVAIVSSIALFAVQRSKKASYYALFVIIATNLFLNSYSYYSPNFYGHVLGYIDAWTANNEIKSSYYQLMDDASVDIERKYRIDSEEIDRLPNLAMRFKRNGTKLYSSTNDNQTQQFFKDLQLPISSSCYYYGLNNRSFLQAALGCKYIAIRNGEEKKLPYGYNSLVCKNEQYSIYESNFALPLVYTFDSIMPLEDYAKLSSLQKQQAMLQVASFEKDNVILPNNFSTKNAQNLLFSDKKLDYTITNIVGDITIDKNGKFSVTKPNSYIEIEMPFYEGEYYLGFENLWYKNTKDRIPENSGSVVIDDGDFSGTYKIRSKYSTFYSNFHDIVYNHGYKKTNNQDVMRFKITFTHVGTYTFDALNVYCQSTTNLESFVKARANDKIDYNWQNGQMTITVDVNADKIVYLAVPFNKNCKAYVDGKKVQAFCVNNFGTGVFVNAGKHSIRVVY